MVEYRKYLIGLLVSASTLIALYVNVFLGIDTVYTHFFYVPVVLTAIWYYWKSVYLALFLGALHVSMGLYATGSIEPGTLIRAASLLAIAIIVATLSEASGRHYDRERQASEEELGEARKRAELYVDLMGHDINNLNQVGIGYLEMAIDTMDGDDERKNLLRHPLESMQNSSRLIENVRKLQSIQVEGCRHEIIDLGAMLAEVKAEYSIAPDREVVIEYQPAPGYLVDASRLIKEAFGNLMSNAIRHSAGRVKIKVTLEEKKSDGRTFYQVGIEDDGPGIPDAVKSKLLSRAMSGRARTRGRGLGLYLARTVIEDANGTIQIEDRIPGDYTKGSRFVIILPACESQ